MYSHESIASALSEIGSCDGRGLLELGIYNEVQLLNGTASGWIDHHRPGPPGFCFHRGEMTMKTFLYPSSMPHGVGGGK